MLAEQEHVDVRIYSAARLLVRKPGSHPPRQTACLSSMPPRGTFSAKPFRGDVVFLASLRMPQLMIESNSSAKSVGELIALEASPGSIEERRRALSEAAGIIGRFAARGLHVMIDAPKPVFMAEAFRCSDWFNRENSVCRGGLALPRADLLAAGSVMNRSPHFQPRSPTWRSGTLCRHCAAERPVAP